MIETVSGPTLPDPDAITTREELAAALTILRQHANLSIRDLVAASGVPHGTVSGWMSGQHAPVAAYRQRFDAVLSACGVTEETERERWWSAAGRARQAPVARSSDRRPPYQGLQAFEPDDSAWFFGREQLIERAVQALTELASRASGAPAMLAVIGPSGSGKSSLIRAGILPTIGRRPRDNAAPVLERWHSVLLTPGSHPGDTLSNLTLRPPTVLCIDQFEELWTLCGSQQERGDFLRSLQALAAPGNGYVVTLGLRADFYAAAARQPELQQPLQESQLLVGPMSIDELREVILEPARRAGVRVDGELVKVLLGDLASRSVSSAHDSGGLPLLSHALLVTWQRSNRRRMTVSDYYATGGIAGAIEQAAETTYESLTPRQREGAQHLFLRAVTVDGDIVTRRRLQLSEVFRGVDEADVDMLAAIDAFSNARLLTRHADAVEITHEALITAWPRLNNWIVAGRSALIMHRRLSVAARMWESSGRDDSALLSERRLATYREWARSGDQAFQLNRLETEFLQSSEESCRHQREHQERAARSQRRLTRAALVLGVFGALLAVLSTAGYLRADRQQAALAAGRDEARSRQVAAEAQRTRTSQPSLATQLAVAAYRISDTLEARSALLDASAISPPISGSTGNGSDLASSAASHLLAEATSGAQADIRLFDLGTAGKPRRQAVIAPDPGEDQLSGVTALSVDGALLAAGTSHARIETWRIAGGLPSRLTTLDTATPGSSHSSPDPVRGLAVAQHTLLAAVGTRSAAVVFDLDPAAGESRPASRLEPAAPVLAVALTADARLAAVAAADGLVRLWDVTRPRQPSAVASLGPVDAGVDAVAFAPGGSLLAAGSGNGTVGIWEVSDPAHPRELAQVPGPQGAIRTLAFSADGSRLSAAGEDGRLWIFDLTVPSEPKSWAALEAYEAPVAAATFVDPDNQVVGTGYGGRLTFWSTDPALAARQVCSARRQPISPAQWTRYLPGVGQFDPCR